MACGARGKIPKPEFQNQNRYRRGRDDQSEFQHEFNPTQFCIIFPSRGKSARVSKVGAKPLLRSRYKSTIRKPDTEIKNSGKKPGR
jgi:hypothetical protein